MNSTIIQWRIYLDSVMDDGIMMDKEKVDDFVAKVERAKIIYSEVGGARNHQSRSKSEEKITQTLIIY
jgi:hypothetical protein